MYESFYNLTEPPFRLTPDPRFYFSSATHKRALTHLRFGFHQREGFVVITGKPGTGKTELMLHLLEGLPHDRITYGKIVTSNLDANEILQQVAAAFQIPAHGLKKGILLKKLEDVFLQHVRENKRLVLIVDEAHKLSVNSLNELQMLTNFQLSGKAALQCFLSGHDSLKLNLHNPELLHLKQRVITSTFLMPLEKQETQEYIEHRLRCVGWEGDPKFNLSAYTLIHDTTEGIPRQINALCNRILLRAYAEQKHYIDESMVSRAIDDVASEPLAANLPYQQVLSESNGIESYQQSSGGGLHQPVSDQFFRNEEMVAHEVVNEQTTYPYYNDQDETLPLPSVVNEIAHSATGDSVTHDTSWSVVHDSTEFRENRGERASDTPPFDAGQTHARSDDADDEILDEVRKMSDALSNFHNETASESSNLNISELDSDSESDNAENYSTEFTREKSTRAWAAPTAYGSVALLLMAGGLYLWFNQFSNNVSGPELVENSTDDSFVATIKDMLPEDRNANSPLATDSTLDESSGLAGIDITPKQESVTNQDDLVAMVNDEVASEQWDSGALGGQFLKERAEQSPEPAEEQIAKNDTPLLETNTNTIPSKSDEQQKQSVSIAQTEDAVEPKGKTTEKKGIAAASVVAAAKVNKPSADTVTNKKAAPTTPVAKKSATVAAATVPKQPDESKRQSPSDADQQPMPPAVKTKPLDADKSVATADTAAPIASSGNVVVINPAQVEAVVESSRSNADIDKAQLNELLAKLTTAYENGNLNQLLSVLAKDVRSNDGATRRDLKNGYRKLFNITDMRQMTISSVNWSKDKQIIHGEGEFELRVREKGADKITWYGGIISLEVDDREEGAVITRLNYDYK